jgi:hypothetical protein
MDTRYSQLGGAARNGSGILGRLRSPVRVAADQSLTPKVLALQFQVAGAQTGAQGVLARARPFEVRGES